MKRPVIVTDSHQKPLSMPRWYLLMVICLSLGILAAANLMWTSYVDNQRERAERVADRRWCQLLTELDAAYTSVPPTTPTGIRVAEAVRNLRETLQCPPPEVG